MLKCPVCGKPLEKQDKTYQCQSRHSFDIAREGYVNLLTVKEKSSRNPGDSKEMLLARRMFLAKGFYTSISRETNKVVKQEIKKAGVRSNNPFTIADIGCGEGYYLCQLYEDLKEWDCRFFGVDIAKEGVRLGSKKEKDITWIAGNVFKLPLMENMANCCLSMFTVECLPETERILKNNALYIRAFPGKNHLTELKEIMYDEIQQRERIELKRETLQLRESRNISYQISLDNNEDIMNLLVMTPHYWNVRPEKIQRLKAVERIILTVDVNIEVFQKRV